jgi:hypothetical protein
MTLPKTIFPSNHFSNEKTNCHAVASEAEDEIGLVA